MYICICAIMVTVKVKKLSAAFRISYGISCLYIYFYLVRFYKGGVLVNLKPGSVTIMNSNTIKFAVWFFCIAYIVTE